MTDTAKKGLFARLPVGRSASVRAILIAGALVTAPCVLWIQQLRYAGDLRGLSPIFYVLFTFFDYSAAMLALGIVLAALFVPRWDGFARLLRFLGENPVSIAIFTAVALSIGAVVVYRTHPLAMDEYAHLFQSQVFAAGHIAGKLPPDLLNFLIPEGFQNHFLVVSKVSGEVSAYYWPSFSLLLTPFTLLGIPWACNPVLSGLTLIVLNRLALRLFGSVEAAGMVTLLTLASPVFFADGISYYSMTSHMLANALFALLVLDPTPRRLFLAGVVGSISLTLHNPVPHMLFALPWFVWLAFQQKPIAKFAALGAGYLPLSIAIGIGWFLHTGSLSRDGMPALAVAGNFAGVSGAFAWPTASLGFARLVGLAKILLWAAPCVLVLAFAGASRRWRDSRLAVLAACAALTFIGYLFVWADQGHGWGFRYFHSAWLSLPLLATAFLFAPTKAAQPADTPVVAPAPDADLRSYVVACAVLSLFAAVGLRALQIREFMDDHLGGAPHYAGTEPRVVVIAGVGFYPYDLIHNDPFLRKGLVYMIDLGAEATAAAVGRLFPSYHVVYRDEHGEVWSAAAPQTGHIPARVQ